MNSARFCLSFFAVALLGISGCGRTEPVKKITRPVAIEDSTSQPVIQNEVSRSLPVEPQLPEDSGVTVWAHRFEGKLIAGLDGSLYVPYGRATIERVQKALIDRGLYTGPANGVLDRPTMESIYQFQEANFNLQRCGIPTPRTRNMLQQGSHTDLNS
jgi:Putative peptidoglycan binding domain